MISFYKPNSKNTGTACSFSVNTKDGSLWSSLIKQSSWNEGAKIGSFSENRDNPQKSAKIKFSMTEAAGLLETLDKNVEFSAYHSSDKQVTKIKFVPYMRDDKQVGFSYSVLKENKENIENKQSFLLGLYFNEARLLKEFLTHSLHSIFKSQEIEMIKKIKNSKPYQESNQSQPSQSQSSQSESNHQNDDGELW
jgi:hypothetical protein